MIKAKAWTWWNSVSGQEFSLAKPSSKDCVDLERMYSETDVNALITAAKNLIDATADKCEFKRDAAADEAFIKLRDLTGHTSEEWAIKRTAYEMASKIDEMLTKLMKDRQ